MGNRNDMKHHPKVSEWLTSYDASQGAKRLAQLDKFLEYEKKTVEEVLKEYEDTKDKAQWSKKWGREIVKFCDSLIVQGYKINSARTFTIGARGFFSYAMQEVKVKRGAIPKQQVAMNEHDFVQKELMTMFFFANGFDKALLSTGVSMGMNPIDFLGLKKKDMQKTVEYAVANNMEFVYIDSYRTKTGERTRSFLMPEAIKCLKAYLSTIEGNQEKLFDLSPDALNDHLKAMVKAANVVTRGTVEWKLLRKFLFNSALRATDMISAKLLTGKSVPVDLLTYYLEGGKLQQEFKKVYPLIRLAENGDRLNKAETELKTFRTVMVKLIREALGKDIDPNMADEDVIALYMKQ